MTDILDRRRAGVLLHPSSLPGPQSIGTIGAAAHQFVDLLADCGLSLWQMLPLGPTHADGSPYQSLSAHAGNPLLIDLEWLIDRGLLKRKDLSTNLTAASQLRLLERASDNFYQTADLPALNSLRQFRENNANWLPDYALYLALRQEHNHCSWEHWPKALRLRDEKQINAAMEQHRQQVEQIEFIQYVFFQQWQELRDYASKRGVGLFGDMPIYVSLDSADVWAERQNFLIDDEGQCQFVAGVPPDAFSDDGQLWGNPLFDWEAMQADQFDWWIRRFRTQLSMFDYIRMDHFRGLQACWQIPADAETAAAGEWVESPGEALLNTLFEYFDNLPLIAEDLGLITPEVMALRDQFDLPGMKILQFGFDGDNRNLYLPHNHNKNSVVYTGTHDNDTTLGWYQQLAPHARTQLHHYMGHSEHDRIEMPWPMIRMALASVADFTILPLQDMLSLDSSHRMNTPGTTEGNWQWRFRWDQIWPGLSDDMRGLLALYDRL